MSMLCADFFKIKTSTIIISLCVSFIIYTKLIDEFDYDNTRYIIYQNLVIFDFKYSNISSFRTSKTSHQ